MHWEMSSFMFTFYGMCTSISFDLRISTVKYVFTDIVDIIISRV
jgi:hypothetical protein